MKQAGLGRRLSAVLADWAMAIGVSLFFKTSSWQVNQATRIVVFFFEIALLTALTQASAGQRLLKLKVVDFQTGGFVPPIRILIRTVFLC